MDEAEAKALFERMHVKSTEIAVDVSDRPFTAEEIEALRKPTVTAEEALCIDFWGEEQRPKNHQLRPGSLMVRGHAVAGGCLFVLFDPLYIRSQKQVDGWKNWSGMLIRHKEQCLACRKGTAMM